MEPLPTIPHIAQAAALRFGDAPALLEKGETWSFNQLWDLSRRMASALLSRGIGKGDRIAIWAPNCREWIVVALGVQIIGAAVVPLNTRLKGREAGDILRRTRARMLFTFSAFLGTDFGALLAGEDLPDLEATLWLDDDKQWGDVLDAGQGAADPAVAAAMRCLGPDDISDIMFTSGTTGLPKGVLTRHGQVWPAFSEWVSVMQITPGERYLIVNPFFHSFGFKAGWVACLIAGAVIVPLPFFDVRDVIVSIERDRIAFLPGPPTIYQALLSENERQPFDTSSLRGAVTGAASVPPVLIERMKSELGLRDVVTAYGMTECNNISTCRHDDPVELIANSCGRAFPGLDVKCADDKGQEVARGTEGEVLVRGYGVMAGYLDDPEATAEAIDIEGWLHTGDVGVMDDQGYLRITDRKKDMYISGGFNCYPAEIERLFAPHPAISMVAIIGTPDERMGEVGKAFIVPRPGVQLNENELLAWARANMANYKVPRSIVFVDALPTNASGKVLKRELRDAG